MGLYEQLKLFHFDYENEQFSKKFFDQNHPKILRKAEFLGEKYSLILRNLKTAEISAQKGFLPLRD